MNVFISWAGADREVKNVIAAKLREENIDYFDSDEFCISDFSSDCIKKIRLSSVFIVIVSDASMDPKSYVKNEVIEARKLEGEGMLNILVYKITDSPYSETFTFNLNHVSVANHVSRTMRSGIDTLIKRTKELLKRRLEGNPELPYDVLVPKLAGVTVSHGKYFVDGSRDAVIGHIEDAFDRSNAIILSEFFGFGKKSVIRKYAQQHQEINAVEIQGMHTSLYQFFLAHLHFSNINEAAFEINDDKKLLLKKFELLKRLDKNDMLIISDIDLDGEADEFICSLISELKCRIVFITQNSAVDYAELFPVIPVGKMKNEHLFELFFHYYKCADNRDREQLTPYLERFFDDIGGHTKAVELTASVLYKEIRATKDEVISHLSSGSDDNRELKHKVLDVFSGLLSLGCFSDSEKKTLLLISLMASPVISEKALLELMKECGLTDRSAITSLDDHRWITYDSHEKSIYIEPIIAQICVDKFAAEEQDICYGCLEHLEGTFLSKKMYISGFNCQIALTQIENFFRLLKFDILKDVIKAFKQIMSTNVTDFEEFKNIRERFMTRYKDVSFSYEAEYDSDDLETKAARWVYLSFMTAFIALEKTPMLYSLKNINRESADEIRNALVDKEVEDFIESEFGKDAFSRIVSTLDYYSDSEDVRYYFTLLLISMFYAFYKKDFDMLQSKMDELIDFLQNSPQILEDSELCALFLIFIEMLHHTYVMANAYHIGIAFFEKMLLIELPLDIRYKLLLLYCDCLLSMNNEEELALSVIETAEDIFDEAISGDTSGKADYITAKQELALYYVNIYTHSGDLDSAIEKYTEIKNISDTHLCTNYMMNMLGLIADSLMADNLSKAVSFIEENRPQILQYMEGQDGSDSIKKNLESLLLVCEMRGSEEAMSFSSGGIIADESYYQRYSKDKKNNLFLMMSYERIVKKIEQYDFSAFTNDEITEYSRKLYLRAASGESKASITPEAFALASEAGFRVLGYRHHKVQYIGAAAMLDGKIAEILNGEGKTYTIVLVAYVNSLYKQKTIVLDSSKYLTNRNYNWMKGIYELLGVNTGYIRSAKERTVLFEASPERIIYSDLASLNFSILNNEQSDTEELLDLSVFSTIVDEADSVLIESANTPFVITGQVKDASDHANKCMTAYKLVRKIKNDEQYYSVSKNGTVILNREISTLIESEFHVNYENLAQSNEISSIETIIKKAIHCLSLARNKDFFIKNEKIFMENKLTGDLYEVDALTGFFLALENGVSPNGYWTSLCQKSNIHNSSHVYSILSRIGTLCGTSATVCSFKKEFKDIYGLDVVAIPPALPIQRNDMTVGLYVTRQKKNEDILELISEKHKLQQPVLLIVENIEESAEFSSMLKEIGIRHTVINGLNSEKSPEIFANAGTYGSVVIATQLANRGVDIKLGGDAERMTVFELVENGVDISGLDRIVYRLPSDEVKSGELYRIYSAALNKNKAVVASNKEKVMEAGGLCVISTTAYADMRIEQQIRGRAGRQGDIGESYVFISIEDDLLRQCLYKMKNSDFFRQIATELDIIDNPFLKRSIENYKTIVHHKTYESMKNSAVSSICKDRSKKEIFKLKYGLSDGSVTFDDIIKIWCKNEDNIKSFREIAEGNAENATSALYHIYRCYPQLFAELDTKNLYEKLFEIVHAYVSESGPDDSLKTQIFISETISLLSLHLTEMQEAEEMYTYMDIKNPDKFFMELYEKNLVKNIVEAISNWLIALCPLRAN